MIGSVAQHSREAYGVKHFVVDESADVKKLDRNVTPGSTAFVIETSETYMLSNKYEWKKVLLSSGGGSGSGSGSGTGSGGGQTNPPVEDEEEDVIIIYDGGKETEGGDLTYTEES